MFFKPIIAVFFYFTIESSSYTENYSEYSSVTNTKKAIFFYKKANSTIKSVQNKIALVEIKGNVYENTWYRAHLAKSILQTKTKQEIDRIYINSKVQILIAYNYLNSTIYSLKSNALLFIVNFVHPFKSNRDEVYTESILSAYIEV